MARLIILYDRVRWEEKQIAEEAKALGAAVTMIDVRSLPLEITSNIIKEKFDGIVLQRCISHTRGIYYTAILEEHSVNVINSFFTTMITSNKLFTTLKLIKNNVPTPRTGVAFSYDAALRIASDIGYPVVIKPILGSWGRLVNKARDQDELSSLLEARELLPDPLYQVYYLQEYIKRPSRDIRSIVVGDEIVAVTYRYQPENDWRTNVARGGTVEKAYLSKDEREIILRAAMAVGGGILGIDAMESNKGILVHEINGTVEFRGAASVWGNIIPRSIAEYAIKIAKK
ncbi:MAG: lysine biosynthesis protein LysX [Thermoprotei archaeon]